MAPCAAAASPLADPLRNTSAALVAPPSAFDEGAFVISPCPGRSVAISGTRRSSTYLQSFLEVVFAGQKVGSAPIHISWS